MRLSFGTVYLITVINVRGLNMLHSSVVKSLHVFMMPFSLRSPEGKNMKTKFNVRCCDF